MGIEVYGIFVTMRFMVDHCVGRRSKNSAILRLVNKLRRITPWMLSSSNYNLFLEADPSMYWEICSNILFNYKLRLIILWIGQVPPLVRLYLHPAILLLSARLYGHSIPCKPVLDVFCCFFLFLRTVYFIFFNTNN